jgi:3-methyladenine DNA glycosylase AlkD
MPSEGLPAEARQGTSSRRSGRQRAKAGLVLTAAAARRRTRALADPQRAIGVARFFKTGPGEYGAGDRFLGIRVPDLRRLTRAYQDMPLAEVQLLLTSSWHEERLLALLILVGQYGRADDRGRASIYRAYLTHSNYVNNWDLVDCSAEHIVGAHLRHRDRARLRRLTASKLVWERRIAVLSTFHYIRRGEYGETLGIARRLIGDSHDLIHKAVGWMLREVGNRDRGAEEEFLRAHASRMPRTMLRYAIEKFPEPLRRRYLGM